MSTQESGTVAVLAEKPSVARDIASVLGATRKGDGYLHGNGYVVTWAIGHLAALAQPHEIHPSWRQWRRELLPLLPKHWPLVVYEKPNPSATQTNEPITVKFPFDVEESSLSLADEPTWTSLDRQDMRRAL